MIVRSGPSIYTVSIAHNTRGWGQIMGKGLLLPPPACLVSWKHRIGHCVVQDVELGGLRSNPAGLSFCSCFCFELPRISGWLGIENRMLFQGQSCTNLACRHSQIQFPGYHLQLIGPWKFDKEPKLFKQDIIKQNTSEQKVNWQTI